MMCAFFCSSVYNFLTKSLAPIFKMRLEPDPEESLRTGTFVGTHIFSIQETGTGIRGTLK